MVRVRVTLWDEVFYERSPEYEIDMPYLVFSELVERIDGYWENDGDIFYTSDNKISMEVIA